MQLLGLIFIFFVKAYQRLISPLLGKNCIYAPTCSAYMIKAIKQWGPFRGVYLGLRRILSCHPWSKGGYDPVPKKEVKHDS